MNPPTPSDEPVPLLPETHPGVRHKPGDRVFICDPHHPRRDEVGRLIEYGPYGPPIMRFKGWLVEADKGPKFYARDDQFSALRRWS